MIGRHLVHLLARCAGVGMALCLPPVVAWLQSPALLHRFDWFLPWFFWALFAVGLLLVGIALLIVAFPRLNPTLAALARLGPPWRIARDIDRELASSSVVQIGESVNMIVTARHIVCPPIHVTARWLVQLGEIGLRVARLADIIWVRRLVFFPDLPPHDRPALEALQIFQRDGSTVTFASSPEAISRLQVVLQARLPGVGPCLDHAVNGFPLLPEGIAPGLTVFREDGFTGTPRPRSGEDLE